VTWTIIAICVVLNLLQHVPRLGVTEALMLVPAWTAAEPWRLITSAFLHDPTWPFHILLNMYALFLIGPYLEHLFGRVYYVIVYLLTALGGSAGFILIAGGYGQTGAGVYLTSALGASGAVFGLFGALFIVQRKLGRQMGQIAVIIAINLVFGFVVSGIAWQAHVGGLVAGLLLGGGFVYAPRRNRTAISAGLVTLLTALCVVLVAARTAALTG